ncbi:bacteriocin-like protein [Chryseobacterium sp. YIM B08800]|uniref:bacteriocin-like protein n=1 Tax=Chryseobacterium sp. YIM B08800 TaxID=2984136 RepID=UPI00223FBFA4|nr:hypothetical protein [Chryseobacterium sp. YIM B08800]
MKNLKKISRKNLKEIYGGGGAEFDLGFDDGTGGGESCKQCVACSNRQGSQSCYTDPGGDCGKALSMAKELC